MTLEAINTLLKAFERYAILTAGRQDLRKRGQPVNPWLKEKGEKYLRGWDQRTTIILLGTSVLLTLYRFIGSLPNSLGSSIHIRSDGFFRTSTGFG